MPVTTYSCVRNLKQLTAQAFETQVIQLFETSDFA
jgi:hypothetical protein